VEVHQCSLAPPSLRFADLADNQLTVIAASTNDQWATGTVDFDPSSGAISIHLDNGETIVGQLNTSSCMDILWSSPSGVVWLKVPHVDVVHVVFMNHLDVGYNGIPQVGFINNILNIYFHEYFPRAIRLAEEMNSIDPEAGFIYTTHPWLISLYLDCPPNLILNSIPLECPSENEIQDFKSALAKGYVSWHGGPMNMQVELMNEDILKLSLQLSANLDVQFSAQSRVLSQRDVPGLTGAAIPTFLQYGGINTVTVGVNPGSAPPDVPKLFRWEYNNQSVLGLWHPGGYPLNPGDSLANPGGLSYMDCVFSEADASVLAFAFRTDNTGPPMSIEEIQTCYNILQEEFPGAQVFASTLDGFASKIANWSSLPVVAGEIGDTWIQGVASDPLKMAQFRALSSAFSQCLLDGKCEGSDFVVQNASRFLIKLAEHTWGLPDVHDTVNWTNTAFQKARNGTNYLNAINSWIEQRTFVNYTLQTSEGHALYDYLTYALADISPSPPSLDGYKEVDPTENFKLLSGSVTLGFDSKGGWINKLMYQYSAAAHSYTFASTENPLAVLSYHTYNESDFQFMNSLYDYYGNAGYDKPNSTANAHPNSSIYYSMLSSLYQSQANPADFILQVKYDPFAHSYYGAPELVWIRLVLSTIVQPPKLTLNFELVWINKTPTRLAEATMFSFTPVKQSAESIWVGSVQKITESRSVPFNSVVKNGSQYQHVAQQVILNDTTTESVQVQMTLASLEVPLVCPIVSGIQTPTPFPAPLDPIDMSKVLGVAFNLHNNIWNTNYPLWYPFEDKDENFKAKFSVSFTPFE